MYIENSIFILKDGRSAFCWPLPIICLHNVHNMCIFTDWIEFDSDINICCTDFVRTIVQMVVMLLLTNARIFLSLCTFLSLCVSLVNCNFYKRKYCIKSNEWMKQMPICQSAHTFISNTSYSFKSSDKPWKLRRDSYLFSDKFSVFLVRKTKYTHTYMPKKKREKKCWYDTRI